MTLQQLEYIIAVDKHRHFTKAAEQCFVTQPTLSAMIQKLEEELDVKIFDRNKQPVCPTQAGALIIKQAREILVQVGKIKNIIEEEKNELVAKYPTCDKFIKRYIGGEDYINNKIRYCIWLWSRSGCQVEPCNGLL